MATNPKRAIEAATAIVVGLAYCATAAAGPPAAAAASAAYGIYAQFRQDGNTVPFGPLAEIGGKAPPAYDDRVAAGQVHQVVPIVAGRLPVPSLFVDAVDFTSHVASKGFGIDAISSEADTAAKRLNFALMLNPPPPVMTAAQPVVPTPFLTLSAESVRSTADFSLVVPRTATVVGSAAFQRLVVAGSLVGNQRLLFSGEAGKNTVLYQSPQMTITLNQEILSGLISCSPTCVFTPNAITTYAVDIALDRADLFGRIVSGEILIGMADAE